MEKALLVGLQLGREKRWSVEDSLEELGRLADTAGAKVVDAVIQHRSHRDPAFLIGPGKAEQIGELCIRWGVDLVIFDDDLSPAQIQNLEKKLFTRVIDRTSLILDIFAKRARTSEGKLQVELAQLQYLLSHLVGKGRLFSQLGGGIGTRGPGETQLELDRRKIRRRIDKLEEDLLRVRKTRALHRDQRRSASIPTVVLVGYTNSGKSTLFNRLTRAGVLVEDRLFATLDPTVRRVKLSGKREILLSDTVGFIQRLPHQLIAAFKATLEEILETDLLLHVMDISHPLAEKQRESVQKVLEELGADRKPRLEVYNKIDLLSGHAVGHSNSENPREGVFVSAMRGDCIQNLIGRLETMLFPSQQIWQLMIPAERGDILASLYRLGKVTGCENQKQGIRLEAEVPAQLTDTFLPFRIVEGGQRKTFAKVKAAPDL